MHLNIDLILLYSQGVVIAFVATVVVGLIMRRPTREFMRLSAAGVGLGVFVFSWARSATWADKDIMAATFVAAGYADVLVRLAYDYIPRIVKYISTKNGVPESDTNNPDNRPTDAGPTKDK